MNSLPHIETNNYGYSPLRELTAVKNIMHARLARDGIVFTGTFEDYVGALCIEASRAYKDGEIPAPVTQLVTDRTMKGWYFKLTNQKWKRTQRSG